MNSSKIQMEHKKDLHYVKKLLIKEASTHKDLTPAQQKDLENVHLFTFFPSFYIH